VRSGAPGNSGIGFPVSAVATTSPPQGGATTCGSVPGRGRGRRLVLQLLPALRLAIAHAPIFPAIGNHDSADSEGSDDRAQMEDNFHVPERFHHGGETASVMPGLFSQASSSPASTPRSTPSRRRSTATSRRQNTSRGCARPSAGAGIAGSSRTHTIPSIARGRTIKTIKRCWRRSSRSSTPPTYAWSSPVMNTTFRSARSAAGRMSSPVRRPPRREGAGGIRRRSHNGMGAQAHLLLIEVNGPEATLTPITGLLNDGRLHLMTALTLRNELVEPPLTVRND
jgi:tartrate-resistant acid phosphatase type 5